MTLHDNLLIARHHPSDIPTSGWQERFFGESVTAVNPLLGSDELTIAFKNRFTAANVTASFIGISGNNNAQHGYMDSTQQLSCRFPFTGGLVSVAGSTGGDSLLNVESTLIMTAKDSVLSMYRDGAIDGSGAYSGTVPSTSFTTFVYGYTGCQVIDFMVWDRGLSTDEVVSLHDWLMQDNRFESGAASAPRVLSPYASGGVL